jgi:hypothetical protein
MMGAWGAGAFDNDDALDLLDDLMDGDAAAILRDALSAAADGDVPVGALDAAAALAAAELVAAMGGRPAASLPDAASAWLRANPAPPTPWMLDAARRAVDAVSRDSELRDLWLQTGEAGAWEEEVRGLRERLG